MVENKSVTPAGTRRENFKTRSELQNADARSSIAVVVSTKFQKYCVLQLSRCDQPARSM
jgi:hypothetical protein